MSIRPDSEPAFPRQLTQIENPLDFNVRDLQAQSGMTLRQYAAIHLRVPLSGEPWLDEMIREAQRMELMGQALTGLLGDLHGTPNGYANDAREIADAMLAAKAAKEQKP